MQKLTFITEVLHLASFWKWELLELGHAGRPHFSLSPLSFATTKSPKKLVKFVPQNSPIVNLYNLMDIELN